eukprot:6375461-Prymnesium_polylepis.1
MAALSEIEVTKAFGSDASPQRASRPVRRTHARVCTSAARRQQQRRALVSGTTCTPQLGRLAERCIQR